MDRADTSGAFTESCRLSGRLWLTRYTPGVAAEIEVGATLMLLPRLNIYCPRSATRSRAPWHCPRRGRARSWNRPQETAVALLPGGWLAASVNRSRRPRPSMSTEPWSMLRPRRHSLGSAGRRPGGRGQAPRHPRGGDPGRHDGRRPRRARAGLRPALRLRQGPRQHVGVRSPERPGRHHAPVAGPGSGRRRGTHPCPGRPIAIRVHRGPPQRRPQHPPPRAAAKAGRGLHRGPR